MKRPLPTPVGDVALLATRVLLGVIMLAHGYQKLVVDGIGRTTSGFESMSIPLAIVSASFVTVVELVGGTLLILGLLTTVVAGLMGVVMAGAAAFVHARHGVFVSAGGWELVGSIAGALLALAAAGPGRLSLAYVVRARARRAPTAAIPPPAPRARARVGGGHPAARTAGDAPDPPRPAARTGGGRHPRSSSSRSGRGRCIAHRLRCATSDHAQSTENSARGVNGVTRMG